MRVMARLHPATFALPAIVLVAVGCSSSAATSATHAGTAESSAGASSAPAASGRQHHHHHRPGPHLSPAQRGGIPDADEPRHSLTPGVALRVGAAAVCRPGYASSVRDVPSSEASAVYSRYGVAHVPYAHEVDHLVSLEIGGSNAIGNLWPEPYAGRWGARTKDVLENRLHELVCSGRLRLATAQHMEARNWVAAYRRFVGGSPPRPEGESHSSGSGGYYLSSYPSASTIYCADDSSWRSLSTRYLRHFRTLKAARSAYPGYHLHQPC
jgi:hypothetical protein